MEGPIAQEADMTMGVNGAISRIAKQHPDDAVIAFLVFARAQQRCCVLNTRPRTAPLGCVGPHGNNGNLQDHPLCRCIST